MHPTNIIEVVCFLSKHKCIMKLHWQQWLAKNKSMGKDSIFNTHISDPLKFVGHKLMAVVHIQATKEQAQ